MSATTQRVGRNGFTGSPITDWCESCRDYVIRSGTRCVWCDSERPEYRPPANWRSLPRRDMSLDARIVELRARGYSHARIGQALGMTKGGVGYRLSRIALEAAA